MDKKQAIQIMTKASKLYKNNLEDVTRRWMMATGANVNIKM